MEFLEGTTLVQLVEQLDNRVKMEITTFMIFFTDSVPSTLELFAESMMPAFK